MKTISRINEENVVFLSDSFGEGNGVDTIENNLQTWYDLNCPENEFLQYIGKFDGKQGIISIFEIEHPRIDYWNETKEWYTSEWINLGSEGIVNHLEKVVQEMDGKMRFDVMLGLETGIRGVHEIGVFIPFGTSKKEIEEEFAKIDDVNIIL